MKIKKAVLLLPALMFFLAWNGCQYMPGVEGNGIIQTEIREIPQFSELEISGGFSVTLEQGDQAEVQIEADENLLRYIVTEVVGNTLMIKTSANIQSTMEIEILVTFVNLARLDLSGAIDVEGKGDFQLDNFLITASGASTVSANLFLNKLNVDMSGASYMNLTGKTDQFKARLSGASDLSAFDFETKQSVIKVSGAGDVRIFATEYLHVTISGAGSVVYRGDPRVEQEISGAGRLSKN
ncbi:MAG TPA: head GIN domain-containing protein [Bacteroidales bacterium]|nr:head GIN domain-containing protein [Bacteroidales bacterium]